MKLLTLHFYGAGAPLPGALLAQTPTTVPKASLKRLRTWDESDEGEGGRKRKRLPYNTLRPKEGTEFDDAQGKASMQVDPTTIKNYTSDNQ